MFNLKMHVCVELQIFKKNIVMQSCIAVNHYQKIKIISV